MTAYWNQTPAILPHDRDTNGRLPIFENGRYRFLTADETAAVVARETADASAEAERTAEWIAAGRPGDYIPHPHNANRVSYGRAEPTQYDDDGKRHGGKRHGGNNWPQLSDGTTP